MTDKPKSERQLIAERIAEYLRTSDLCTPFGGDVSLYRGGRTPCYVVAFSKPRVLDGTVSVYSRNFIQVRFQTSYRALPNAGSFVFKSEANALSFIRLAFVDMEFEKALDLANLLANRS